MLLTSTHPHEDLSINVLDDRFPLWPVDLPSHLCVLAQATMDGGVGVRLRSVLRIVVDPDIALPLWAIAQAFKGGKDAPPFADNYKKTER